MHEFYKINVINFNFDVLIELKIDILISNVKIKLLFIIKYDKIYSISK